MILPKVIFTPIDDSVYEEYICLVSEWQGK